MATMLRGVAAGAAGTAALNTVTYLDMALRARPASSTPEQSVQRLAEKTGIRLGQGEQAERRKAGLGPLLGYATGIGAGAVYALLARRRWPLPAAAAALTALVVAASDTPLTLLGVTDVRRWSLSDWVADLVPHLAYGVATAAVYQQLSRADHTPPGRERRHGGG